MENNQIKSKKRVADHGEVFTAEREVNAMLDLVKDETERIESRFLEPACGNGNFLAEILRRKLNVAKERYEKNPLEYEMWSIYALMSMYGVELLEDNVKDCKKRLFEIWDKEYIKICKDKANEVARKVVKYVLDCNILCGDALTLKQSNGKPIIFAEWSFVTSTKVKRRDFRLDEMLEGNTDQMSLFMVGWEYDEEREAYIPLPIKEYPLIDYRDVYKI